MASLGAAWVANRQFAELLARRDGKSTGGPQVGNKVRPSRELPTVPLQGPPVAALRALRAASSAAGASASALKIQRAWRVAAERRALVAKAEAARARQQATEDRKSVV